MLNEDFTYTGVINLSLNDLDLGPVLYSKTE